MPLWCSQRMKTRPKRSMMPVIIMVSMVAKKRPHIDEIMQMPKARKMAMMNDDVDIRWLANWVSCDRVQASPHSVDPRSRGP